MRMTAVLFITQFHLTAAPFRDYRVRVCRDSVIVA